MKQQTKAWIITNRCNQHLWRQNQTMTEICKSTKSTVVTFNTKHYICTMHLMYANHFKRGRNMHLTLSLFASKLLEIIQHFLAYLIKDGTIHFWPYCMGIEHNKIDVCLICDSSQEWWKWQLPNESSIWSNKSLFGIDLKLKMAISLLI